MGALGAGFWYRQRLLPSDWLAKSFSLSALTLATSFLIIALAIITLGADAPGGFVSHLWLAGRGLYVLISVLVIYLIFYLSAYLLGDLLLALLNRLRPAAGWTAGWLIKLGLGLVAFSLFGFFLCWWQWLSIWPYLAVFALLINLRLRLVIGLFQTVKKWRWQFDLKQSVDWLKIVLLLVITVYLSFAFFNSYKQLTADTDSLRAYYYAPKLFVAQGGFVDFPYDYTTHVFKAAEMLYLPFFYFEPYVINFFNSSLIILLLLALFQLAERCLTKPSAWVSLYLFLSLPLLAVLARTVKTDLVLLLACLLFFYQFWDYWHDRRLSKLLLAGSFLAWAVSIKYSALLILPLLGLWWLLANWRRPLLKNFKQTIGHYLLLLLTIVLVSSPWWLMNLVQYGDPLHPFLSVGNYLIDIFTTAGHSLDLPFIRGWNSYFVKNFVQPWPQYGSHWWRDLYYSVNGLTSRGFASQGSLVAAGLLLMIWRYLRRPADVRSLLINLTLISAGLYLWSRYALISSWYLLFLFPLVLIFGLQAWTALAAWPRRVVAVVTLLLASWTLIGSLQIENTAQKYWSGQLTFYQDYSLYTGHLEAQKFLETDLAASDPDYLVYSVNYFMQANMLNGNRHLIVDPAHEGLSYIYNELGDYEAAKQFLVDHKINYLLVSYRSIAYQLDNLKNVSDPYLQQDRDLLDKMITSSRLIYRNFNFAILDLRYPPTAS